MALNSGRHETNPTARPGRNRGAGQRDDAARLADPRHRSRWWRWGRQTDELDTLVHQFAGQRRRLRWWWSR